MKIKLFTIPNCVTLCNLLCGMGALSATFVYEDLELAFWLIVAAAVFDFLDGLTARLLKQYSDVGVQLDSLADMVSFGVAPASMLYFVVTWVSEPALIVASPWDERLTVVPFIIAAFSALRLAKFNVDTTQHEEFCGLPTPACALLCASLAVIFGCDEEVDVACEWIMLLSFVLSLLLISPIRMFSFKFKHAGWRGNELRILFALFAVAMIICLPIIYATPIIIVTYIVVSTLRWIFVRR